MQILLVYLHMKMSQIHNKVSNCIILKLAAKKK